MRLVHDVVTLSQLLLLPNPMAPVSSSSVEPPQSKAALPPLLLASVYSYLYLSLAFLWFEIEIGNESLVLFSFFYCFLRRVSWCDKFCSFLWCFDQEMDQVSFWGFCIFSWSLYLLGLNWVLVDLGVWILWIGCRIRPAGDPPSPRAAHAAAAVGTMVVFQVIEGNVYVKKIGILELGFLF